MESATQSTVCVLLVVIVVKWVFSVLETSRVSQQSQQFKSQRGGREGSRLTNRVRGLVSSTHRWLLTYLTAARGRNASQFSALVSSLKYSGLSLES